jgi:hypothetical protein
MVKKGRRVVWKGLSDGMDGCEIIKAPIDKRKTRRRR